MGNTQTKDNSTPLGRGVQSFTQRQVISENESTKLQIVERNETHQCYVLRRISKNACITQQTVKAIIRERDMLEGLDHPFITGLRFSFQDTYGIYMATDLMSGGNLRELVNIRRFSEAVVRFWAAELSCALHYLHNELGIVHNAVRLENILIDNVGHVALTNFKSAKRLVELPTKNDTEFSIDWWDLGIVMFECLFGKHPFRDSEHLSTTEVVFPVTTDSRITLDCMSVIRGLLHYDVRQRLGSGNRGAVRLKQHPFFATFDWSQLEDREVLPPFAPPDKYSTSDAIEYPELGECLDLKLTPLDPHPDLIELERGFVDYDYVEFYRLRAYLDRHGTIDKNAADSIRQSSIDRDSLDIVGRVASTDVPLEYLTLCGRPLVKTKAEIAATVSCGAYSENNSRNSIADMDGKGRESLSLPRKSSSLGVSPVFCNKLLSRRPASRALKQSGIIVRRTTTTAIERIRGHRNIGGKNKRSSPLSDTPEEIENIPPQTPNRALPIMVQVPPSSVPMDPLTWTQLDSEQRCLARRYCRKFIEENQRLVSMLLAQEEYEELAVSMGNPGSESSVENVLFQSTYSLTASSLLSTTREAGNRRGIGSIIPPTSKSLLSADPMPPLISNTRTGVSQSVTGSINSNSSSCDSNSSYNADYNKTLSGPTIATLSQNRSKPAVHLFSDIRGLACKSTPSLLPDTTQSSLLQSQQQIPRQAPKATANVRRMHAKSAGAVSTSGVIPRLQPIAAKWPSTGRPSDPPKLPLSLKHKRQPFLDISDYTGSLRRCSRSADEIPMSPDPDDWDLLPETLDRLGMPTVENEAAIVNTDDELSLSSIAVSQPYPGRHIMQI
ncbi:kinase-like protein [Coemansia reversa NRRL 1564]|uniref:Kinase-like protein n=1 Tax=Coemansia reversa (strain ATCC 12441 / NRRL 1564) TaxID=763665 RepID=A0A2G5B4X7_COERN|nr:kinase-like protein [Coemansia reversa NRRL 1564]|eukprot:PIA14059.1 kinase-like protein [Coemansia reversa NRRL 1564]